MFPFSSTTNTSLKGQKNTNVSTQKDTPEKVKAEKTVTNEEEYTVHTAEIHYTNGEKEEVEFDSMISEDDYVKLKDYNGYTTNNALPGGGGFTSEAFMMIPYENFNKIETVSRRTETMEYEKTKTSHKKPENLGDGWEKA